MTNERVIAVIHTVPESEWLIELYATMLCDGVSTSAHHAVELRDKFLFDGGFIQGNVLLVDGRPVNTRVGDDKGLGRSSVNLQRESWGWFLGWKGRHVPCRPLSQPQIVRTHVGQYGCISDYVRLHAPQILFAAPLRQCIFGAIGQGCKFCTFEMRRSELVPEELMARWLTTVLMKCPEVTSLAVGGGTPNLVDYGSNYYGSIVRRVKDSFPGIRASIEIVPSGRGDDLRLLRDSGYDAAIMSLEVWDEAIRQRVCPGKGRVSRDEYMSAWTNAIEKFGEGQVASVLLVGLEPEESTIEGIDALVDLGVIPTLIPFRPYNGTPLVGHPRTTVEAYLRCSRYCTHRLRGAGLSPSGQYGCTGCGGCSLEVVQEYGAGQPITVCAAEVT